MTKEKIEHQLREALAAQPLFDVHTHLDANHLSARGLHDILLYHMIISDLASAGCPSLSRLSEAPDEEEVETRITEAIPFLPYLQNTSGIWGIRIILRDLYGWSEPITMSNWQLLHARIQERNSDQSWAHAIFQRAGICRACTELWRGHDHQADDLLQYALEWAFFARAQWGSSDAPLYELECTWHQDKPSPPLPVTLGKQRKPVLQSIHTLDDVNAAIVSYVDKIPYQEVISTAQHISTDIHFHLVSDDEMAAALKKREQASPVQRDTYASYILEKFLTELEQKSAQIVFQFSLGAEPLPYETGSKIRQETIFELAEIISRHPKLHFQAFLSSEHANQALCTLARELPNLSLAGYWWHNLFPSIIRKVIHERLDMVAANKQIGFFSDAYCVDWAYAKWVIVRLQLAHVFADKISQGQYTFDEALSVANQILFETPQKLLRMATYP